MESFFILPSNIQIFEFSHLTEFIILKSATLPIFIDKVAVSLIKLKQYYISLHSFPFKYQNKRQINIYFLSIIIYSIYSFLSFMNTQIWCKVSRCLKQGLSTGWFWTQLETNPLKLGGKWWDPSSISNHHGLSWINLRRMIGQFRRKQ